MRSALVELYLEGGEEAQDAAWAALLAAEAFCRPNKLAALNELTRRLIDGKHTAKVCSERTQDVLRIEGVPCASVSSSGTVSQYILLRAGPGCGRHAHGQHALPRRRRRHPRPGLL